MPATSPYNAAIRKREHLRVFPIWSGSELDVRRCKAEEALEVQPIYVAYQREVLARDDRAGESAVPDRVRQVSR
jgi:hypothetical protein